MMERMMMRLLYLFVLVLIVQVGAAQKPEKFFYDDVRYFSDEKVQEYKSDNKYIIDNSYYTPDQNRRTLKDLRRSKKEKRDTSISLPSLGLGTVGKVIFIVIFVVAIGALAYAFGGGTFRRDTSVNRNNDSEEDTIENIHELNIDQLIVQAEDNGNYTEASRYLFIRSLKLMTDQKIIDWQENKTNRDYYYEIKKRSIRDQFREISLLFEYVVYGDFHVHHDQYVQMKTVFEGFNQKISQ